MTARVDLHIYRSNRTEALVHRLAEVVREPVGGPFSSETIVVQGRGMATWLSQQLADRHGVWANPDYPFPRNYVERCFRAVLGDQAFNQGLISEDRLLWAILQQLPALLEQPEFSRLAGYVRGDARGLRRFQLADRIARRFDEYLTYRPDMMRAWEVNDDAGVLARHAWQPQLWRRVVSRLRDAGGVQHMAALEQALLHALAERKPIANPQDLPQRLSIFGVSSLPPLYLRVVAALAAQVETHVFLFSPSPGDWWNHANQDAITRALDANVDPDDLHLDNGHPLIASMGGLGAEFQRILDDTLERLSVRYQEYELYDAPRAGSTLAHLQQGVFTLTSGAQQPPGGSSRTGRSSKTAKAPLRPEIPLEDQSISIHACHGPMREVEVLHDQLLALLTTRNTTLHPRDVVVMMPDVDEYAPFVEAVFDRDENDEQFIPYRIADRSIHADSPVIEAFARIIDLVGGRATAPQVIDLLTMEAIQRKFDLDPAHLEQITDWIVEARIRWGVDKKHRELHGQPAVETNTWRFGLDRLLLGYGMPTAGKVTFGDVLPYDEIEGKNAELLGRLAEFTARLFHHLEHLRGARPLAGWRDDLGSMLESLLIHDKHTAWQHERIREALANLTDSAAEVAFGDDVDLAIVRSLVEKRVDTAFPERGFLSHGVTFCAMVPMRSIPFRVVCLLGMGDGAFPRAARSVDFDLVKRGGKNLPPRAGDRDRRKDDRYLFLETLMAARERLIITYTGQSIRDNKDRPPSVVVSEILDVLADTHAPQGRHGLSDEDRRKAIEHQLVVRHPLQAFSRRYFDGDDSRLWSYAEGNVEGARQLTPERTQLPSFISGPLAQPKSDLPEARIAVTELIRFYKDPVAYLLQRRLGIYLDGDLPDIPDREPIELDGLDKWHLGNTILGHNLAGIPRERSAELARASGLLPIGVPGKIQFDAMTGLVDEITDAIRDCTEGDPLPGLEVNHQLMPEVKLTGEIGNRWPRGVVFHQFSKNSAKRKLEMWVRHLVLCWLTDPADKNQPRTTILIGRDPYPSRDHAETITWAPVRDAQVQLQHLVLLYQVGLRTPLLFAPDASYRYASERRKKSHDEALRAAQKAYDDGYNGERYWNAHLDRVFGNQMPPFAGTKSMGPDFATLASSIFSPMLASIDEARNQEKKTARS